MITVRGVNTFMPNQSKKSQVIAIRLPVGVISTLQRRINGRRSRWSTVGEYLKERIIYDTERVHRRLF